MRTVSFAFKKISNKDLTTTGKRYNDLFNDYDEKFEQLEWFQWKKEKVYSKLDKIKEKYHIDIVDSYEPEHLDKRKKEEFALERVTELLGISLRQLMKLIPEIKYVHNFGIDEILKLLVVNFLRESITVYQSEFQKILRKQMSNVALDDD